jgi:senataxin
MLGVNTLVLVGDAQQLPATVLSKVAKDYGLGKSLFARLQSCFEDAVRNPVLFLDTQYRMHPDICLWPNRYFYNGRLQSAPNMAEQRGCPLVPYCILSLDYEQSSSGELSNAGEAVLVSQLVLGLLEILGNKKYSIAVITPYNMQRTAITSLLHASPYASQNVEVSTIDGFQGQERDVIVMSCVRTGGIGFLSDSQRLNVALTRARCSLLLCGNFTSLQNDNMWRALLENANQRNVLKHVPNSVARNKHELLKLVLRDN